MSGITDLVRHVELPKFYRVKQKFSHEKLSEEEIVKTVSHDFLRCAEGKILPGQKICITCGSRGISNMPLVTKTLVTLVREMGADPFLVPAMGSHGGATDEGQLEMLRGVGISEETMGCKIYSSMEPVLLGQAGNCPVYLDRYAAQADGIIVLNRVKAHTAFRWNYESGLMKMMAVGLGKQKGAEVCHEMGEDYMGERIECIGKAILQMAPIVMGVAILENAFDQTAEVCVIPAERIAEEEPPLLLRAKERMGKIFLDSCDILIVRAIGKNYSGAGADPNIVGRCANPKISAGVKCQRMGFFDLSDASHGNATGIGRADIISRRLFEKMDFDNTYPNFITCNTPDTFKIPVVAANDEEVLKTCITTCVKIDHAHPRIIMLDNSLEIETILISEAMLEEAKTHERLFVQDGPFSLEFDSAGTMITKI